MSRPTLKDSALKAMRDRGKSPKEVVWVGTYSNSHVSTWLDFARVAGSTYRMDLNPKIMIVGHYWWLHRKDGEWVFNEMPSRDIFKTPFSHRLDAEFMFGGVEVGG